MTQSGRREYLISALLAEQPEYSKMEIPAQEREQKLLLRALFNVRMPRPAATEFLRVQDAYLQEEIRQKGVTELSGLRRVTAPAWSWRRKTM